MYLLFLKEITFNYLFLAILFSTIPDLDVFLSPLRRKFNLKYLDHRGGSHSYVVGMVVSAIFALIYSPITGHPFIIVWIIGSLFYGLHVTMDIFTTTKIPCFYPFSRKEYSFYVEKAGSLFTMLLSVSFLVLSIPIHLDSNIFAVYLNVYITLFLVYYIYRTISKNVLASKLKNNQKYFPGVLPVYYTVLTREMVGDELFFTIKKKGHYTTAKEIFSQKIILNEKKKTLLEKGMELIKNDYYNNKWTPLPVLIETDGEISIRFFLLETMMNKRTMYIQYDFDPLTYHLIRSQRAFGHLEIRN